MHAKIWLLILLFVAPMYAEKYAVIVGAGKFPNLARPDGTPAMDLDGARPDAEKLAVLLSTRFGYDRSRMTVLLDGAATRAAILNALEDVAAKVRPGDQVLVYYSGHGTSSLDPKTGGFGMDPATGAIVPTDLHFDTKEGVLKQLLIGKRDLRPLFERMEKNADVLVVFDACFSGESVRSISLASNTALRYISLADLTRNEISSQSIIGAEKSSTRSASVEYPYRRVVYLAAAANNQFAYDINRMILARLEGRFKTVDGLPHGAMTNALLQVLNEEAAKPPAARAVCQPMFEKVASIVRDQGQIIQSQQDPQLLYSPLQKGIAEGPCFDPRPGQAPPPPQPEPPPSPAPGPEVDVRTELERIAAEAAGSVECRLDRPAYKAGQKTVVECTITEPGYLSLLSYGAGDKNAVLLLPNQYQTSAPVQPGTVRIPSGGWAIANQLPPAMAQQQTLMVVLFSAQPINLKSFTLPEGIFGAMDARAARGFRSQSVVPAYKAARLEFALTR